MNTQEMSGVIECYYGSCPNHGARKSADPDEGPYCYENACTATAEELATYQVLRDEYLRTLPKSEDRVFFIKRGLDENTLPQMKRISSR